MQHQPQKILTTAQENFTGHYRCREAVQVDSCCHRTARQGSATFAELRFMLIGRDAGSGKFVYYSRKLRYYKV
jgi:hypothetical protein